MQSPSIIPHQSIDCDDYLLLTSSSSLGSPSPIDYRQYQHNKSNKRIIVTKLLLTEKEINDKRQKKKTIKKSNKGGKEGQEQ